MDTGTVAFLLPLSGLLAGVVLGFTARRNFFCTLSALEQYWYANNSTGVRTWVFAATIAAIFTQILVVFGLFEPASSFYLTTSFGWLGAIVGGLCFGFGMALIGTCGFGALVRLGGGSLKSLMAVLVLGITALSATRGLLALGRVNFFDPVSLDLSFATSQSIPDIASALVGADLKIVVTVILIAIPLFWVFRDRQYRKNYQAMFTAVIIGAVIAFGWFVTTQFAASSFDPVQVESASFVTPVGELILQFSAFTGAGPDYGIGMVVGTILGAAIAANSADDVRWEACDDARELSRHIAGAAMMGFGGVLALGCTIGQGVSAASLLAVSVPVSMLSIIFGARLGLAWLLEGSIVSAFRR